MTGTSIRKELIRDPSTGVFASVLLSISEKHFYRTPNHLVRTQNFP